MIVDFIILLALAYKSQNEYHLERDLDNREGEKKTTSVKTGRTVASVKGLNSRGREWEFLRQTESLGMGGEPGPSPQGRLRAGPQWSNCAEDPDLRQGKVNWVRNMREESETLDDTGFKAGGHARARDVGKSQAGTERGRMEPEKVLQEWKLGRGGGGGGMGGG